MFNLTWNFKEQECDLCSQIFPNCEDCNENECETCQDTFILTPDNLCIPGLDLCSSEEYSFLTEIDDKGNVENILICDQCDEGYYFSVGQDYGCFSCQDYVNAYGSYNEYCEICDTWLWQSEIDGQWYSSANCTQCSGGYMPSYDQ